MLSAKKYLLNIIQVTLILFVIYPSYSYFVNLKSGYSSKVISIKAEWEVNVNLIQASSNTEYTMTIRWDKPIDTEQIEDILTKSTFEYKIQGYNKDLQQLIVSFYTTKDKSTLKFKLQNPNNENLIFTITCY